MEQLAYAFLLLSTLLQNNQVRINEIIEPKVVLAQEQKLLTTEPIEPYRAWKDKLRQCESGFKDEAINPKDSDGTESYGRYQFKEKTFNWLSKKYGITTTSVWNAEEQELLLDRMIEDKDIDLTKQFPDCIKNRGVGMPIRSD